MTARGGPRCQHAEQAVGFALHALEPAEEVALLEHLPQCAQCRELVDETKGSLALLGGCAPSVDPPPGLKAELMTRIAETPQLRPAPSEHADHDRQRAELGGAGAGPLPGRPTGPVSGRTGAAGLAGPGGAAGPGGPSGPGGANGPGSPGGHAKGPVTGPRAEPPTGPLREPEPPTAPVPPAPRQAPVNPPPFKFGGRRTGPPQPLPPPGRPVRRAGRKQMALLAAAMVAVVGIGGLAIRNVQLEQQRDAKIAQAAQIARVLSAVETQGAQHALLATKDGQTMAAVLVQNGQRELVTVALPANPSDHTYVLWGIANGSPRAIRAFDVALTDSGLHNVGQPQAAELFTGYAISLEPGRAPPPNPSTVMASGLVSP